MSRRNFNKRTMERWGGSIAACLVGVACIMAGVYMDQTTKKDNGYVVDLSELDKAEDTKAEEEKQEELAPANIANRSIITIMLLHFRQTVQNQSLMLISIFSKSYCFCIF